MAMRPEEVRVRYAKIKKWGIRLSVCLALCWSVLLLLSWLRTKYELPGWTNVLVTLFTFVMLCLLAALSFVLRCPCCGMRLHSRMRMNQPKYWFQWVFPRKCWYCHTDFSTGEVDPKQELRWRGVSAK